MSTPVLPLHYSLPLNGTVLVEASAGTGKTYTLERLMARHILWHGRPIESVLAVTFTNAAASDIRQRLRAFLGRVRDAGMDPADADLQQLHGARPDDVDAACWQARLDQALAHIDRAAIHTIHGFCQRLLEDFAIEFGQPMPAPQLLEDESALHRDICERFWRQTAQDPMLGAALDGTPQTLARELPNLLRAPLKPDRPALGPAPDFAAAVQALRTAHAQHRTQAEQALRQALQAGAVNKSSYKDGKLERLFAELDAFLLSPTPDALPGLDKLAYSQIKANKGHAPPDNPLLHALDDWRVFCALQSQFNADRRLAFWHALREFAGAALARHKAEHGLLGFDDLIAQVHAALCASGNEALRDRIRARYPVALIDEFQDTDDRQWQIFEALYQNRADASLVLVGDPKQAIYGFRGGDIHTYLRVQAQVGIYGTLDRNFRSHQALLDAVDDVFLSKGEHPFNEREITYRRSIAGRDDAAQLRLEQQLQPALQLLQATQAPDSGKPLQEAALAECCARDIAFWLQAGAEGRARLGTGPAARALQADDIAVLVGTHKQAELMRQALRQAGLGSAYASRGTLLESYEAHDLLLLLQALSPRGASTARSAARCSVLLAMAYDGPVPWPVLAQALASRGPLAALQPVLDAAQDALMRCTNGARRTANYRQLLALLQSRYRPGQAVEQAARWLARQMHGNGEAAGDGVRPWLESSRAQVRIMTMHQSKGLEFGMVYLPFAALPAGERNDVQLRRIHLDGQYCHYLGALPEHLKAARAAQQQAEQLRLLYVAMTRARFALRCGWPALASRGNSALGQLLGEVEAGARAHSPPTRTAAIVPSAASTPAANLLPAITRLPPVWQVHSFSSLHRGFARQPAGVDGYGLPGTTGRTPFQGPAYGNALHLVLEHVQAGAWLGEGIGAEGLALCTQALRRFGYTAALAQTGAAELAALARACLLAPLPEGICLRDLPAADMRRELEFDLRLVQADTAHMIALLHAHGYCLQRRPDSLGTRLNGLLNGKIDLLYRHQERLYVLDYKSNTLPDYGADSLRASIQDNEYDLQYLLYCVAVHRWQRFRRRDYDIVRHFGGVRYLYARGLDAGDAANGRYCDNPDAGLIERLARCFDAGVRP